MIRPVFLILVVWQNLVVAQSTQPRYVVSVVSTAPHPILSSVEGSSVFEEVFNPSYVAATSTQPRSGLLVRTQNCTLTVGAKCNQCGGKNEAASVLTFSLEKPDGSFEPISSASDIVFQPADLSETCGTEDPRIQYNPADQQYYMFYTAYSCIVPFLHLATTTDPTSASGWVRHGAVFPFVPGSKSAALLITPSSSSSNSSATSLAPYYLLWGDDTIKITNSTDPKNWQQQPSTVLIEPRLDHFDSGLVESGPPPLLLSTGDYLFFYNSATKGWPAVGGYHVGYVILSGANPNLILQRSETPLLSPDLAWEQGVPPYTCNVPNVVFLEGAKSLGNDTFRVFFGGADTVVGTAVISVSVM